MGDYIMNRKLWQQIQHDRFIVHINYYSKYSSGQMIIKGLFFIEKYKKLCRLFRDCDIKTLLVKDEDDSIAIVYLPNMKMTLDWLLEKEIKSCQVNQ